MKKISIKLCFMEKTTSVEEVISHCKRYPIMSKYQLVIIKEAQDLSRKIESLI